MAAEAEAFVTADPLRERRCAALALAQYRCGHQADALRSLSRAATHWPSRPGSMSRGLVELEAAILRQDPGLVSIAQPGCRQRGLPVQGTGVLRRGRHRELCGRQHEVEACLRRLRTTSLLVLAGPSGCGKSSLARAGLIPALRDWAATSS